MTWEKKDRMNERIKRKRKDKQAERKAERLNVKKEER